MGCAPSIAAGTDLSDEELEYAQKQSRSRPPSEQQKKSRPRDLQTTSAADHKRRRGHGKDSTRTKLPPDTARSPGKRSTRKHRDIGTSGQKKPEKSGRRDRSTDRSEKRDKVGDMRHLQVGSHPKIDPKIDRVAFELTLFQA